MPPFLDGHQTEILVDLRRREFEVLPCGSVTSDTVCGSVEPNLHHPTVDVTPSAHKLWAQPEIYDFRASDCTDYGR